MHQTVLIVKKCKEDHTLMKVCISLLKLRDLRKNPEQVVEKTSLNKFLKHSKEQLKQHLTEVWSVVEHTVVDKALTNGILTSPGLCPHKVTPF